MKKNPIILATLIHLVLSAASFANPITGEREGHPLHDYLRVAKPDFYALGGAMRANGGYNLDLIASSRNTWFWSSTYDSPHYN